MNITQKIDNFGDSVGSLISEPIENKASSLIQNLHNSAESSKIFSRKFVPLYVQNPAVAVGLTVYHFEKSLENTVKCIWNLALAIIFAIPTACALGKNKTLNDFTEKRFELFVKNLCGIAGSAIFAGGTALAGIVGLIPSFTEGAINVERALVAAEILDSDIA